MSINVKEARELVAKCIETLDDNKTVEVNMLCEIINRMCEYIEQLENIINKES